MEWTRLIIENLTVTAKCRTVKTIDVYFNLCPSEKLDSPHVHLHLYVLGALNTSYAIHDIVKSCLWAVLNQESERSCTCVSMLEVSIFLLDFRTVLTVWYPLLLRV
jgi:hypothetical protein